MSDPASTKALDDTDEWLQLIKETPMRTLADIQAEREPEWVVPVLALGMQPDYPPPPPLKPYRGPRWWHLSSWLLWNFGDLTNIRKSTYGSKEQPGKHRLVPGMPEEAVYRPQVSQTRGPAASSPEGYLSMPRHARDVARWAAG